MPIRVFINEQPVTVLEGALARAAVEAFDPEMLELLDTGKAYLTDGRGVRLEPDAPLAAGGIVRLISPARREAPGDADA
ncbi:MAG: hypothetical protein ACREL6_11380 [Gemmatimonadales bacterium]